MISKHSRLDYIYILEYTYFIKLKQKMFIKSKFKQLKQILRIIPILAVFLSFAGFINPIVLAQTNTDIKIIPNENVTFIFPTSQVGEVGKQDFKIYARVLPGVITGAKCEFKVRQVLSENNKEFSSSLLTNNGVDTYKNRECFATLPQLNFKSELLEFELLVTNPDGTLYGANLSALVDDGVRAELVDPDNYELYRYSYTKPRVEVIVKDKNLEVGKRTTVQVAITNIDRFVLRNLELNAEIPNEIAKVICDSVQFNSEEIRGDSVKTPDILGYLNNLKNFFAPIHAHAQQVQEIKPDSVKCIDNSKILINISQLKNNQTLRFNLDIEALKPGEFKLNFTTDLDQGRISKSTQPVLVLGQSTSTKSSNSDNPATSTNWTSWILQGSAFIALATVLYLSVKRIWLNRKP